MGKKFVVRYLFMGLSLAMMVTIFIFSAQNGSKSSEVSGEFSAFLKRILSVFLPDGVISSILLSIRKIAHVFAYFCLSLFVTVCVFTFPCKKDIFAVLISVGICLLYAMSDEIHQLFVPDRIGCARDVLIDSIGFLSASFLVYGIRFLLLFQKNKKGKGNTEKTH